MQTLAEQLGAAANELNEALGVAEARFSEAFGQRTCQVNLASCGVEQPLQLQFTCGGLHILRPSGDEELCSIPICNASLRERVQIVGALEVLWDALWAVATLRVQEVQEATAQVRKFTAEITQ